MKSVIEVGKNFTVCRFLLWAPEFPQQAQKVRSVPSEHGQSVKQEQEDGTERLAPRATQPVKGSPLSPLSPLFLLKDHCRSPSCSCKLQT